MKNTTWLVATALFLGFTACSNEKSSDKKIKELKLQADVAKGVDSIMKNIGSDDFNKAEAMKDNCPVKIKSIRIYTPEYSSRKAFSITYTNTGSKKVDAIRFILFGKNNWDEPEKISFLGTAYSYAENQKLLSPGKTLTQSWSIDTGDPTKMKGNVVKIHFTDGSLWSIE